jgi:hypothetical protein
VSEETEIPEVSPDTEALEDDVFFSSTYTRSKRFGKLAAALAAAQAEIPNPTKDKTAKVQTRTGNNYGYNYADLATVLEVVRGPLAKHGIALMQPIQAEGNQVTVTTLLIHESEQWMSAELVMTASDGTPQSIGSATTYGRRYGLTALLGIAAEEDDDGSQASGRKAETGARRAEPPARPQQRPAEQPTQQVPAKEPDWTTAFEALRVKFNGNSKRYFEILKAFGVKEPSEFKDRTKAEACYKTVRGELRKLSTTDAAAAPATAAAAAPTDNAPKADPAKKEPFQASDDDVPAAIGSDQPVALRIQDFDTEEYEYVQKVAKDLYGYNKAKTDDLILKFNGDKELFLNTLDTALAAKTKGARA